MLRVRQGCVGKGSAAIARSSSEVTVWCYHLMRKVMKQKCLERVVSQLVCQGITAGDPQDLMCTHDCNP